MFYMESKLIWHAMAKVLKLPKQRGYKAFMLIIKKQKTTEGKFNLTVKILS